MFYHNDLGISKINKSSRQLHGCAQDKGANFFFANVSKYTKYCLPS